MRSQRPTGLHPESGMKGGPLFLTQNVSDAVDEIQLDKLIIKKKQIIPRTKWSNEPCLRFSKQSSFFDIIAGRMKPANEKSEPIKSE